MCNRRQLFINELSKYDRALELFEKLSQYTIISFVGGSVRSVLTEYNKSPIKDFDCCVIVEDREGYNSVLKNYKINFNRFGGLKIFLTDMIFDIWELKRTCTIINEVPTFEDLSKSANINFDGIVYDFTNDILYDEPFLDCVNTKIIKVLNYVASNSEYNILKAKKISKLYDFKIDEGIISPIK